VNLSIEKLPWYGQIGVFVLLSLGGAFAFWTYYAKPAQESIETTRAQVTQVQGEVARAMATARRLPEFRRETAALEAQLAALRTVLPEEKDVADLLRRIQGMATQSNLSIRGFVPRAVTTRQLYAEWPIGLQLEGTYHNLGRFLERVSKFPRIINVSTINIKAGGNPAQGETIAADCTATTFVMSDQPAPAAAPPGGRRGAPPAAARTE
jgi:type IV pilus assembly protein PilO